MQRLSAKVPLGNWATLKVLLVSQTVNATPNLFDSDCQTLEREPAHCVVE